MGRSKPSGVPTTSDMRRLHWGHRGRRGKAHQMTIIKKTKHPPQIHGTAIERPTEVARIAAATLKAVITKPAPNNRVRLLARALRWSSNEESVEYSLMDVLFMIRSSFQGHGTGLQATTSHLCHPSCTCMSATGECRSFSGRVSQV